jgi:hypothetical protein
MEFANSGGVVSVATDDRFGLFGLFAHIADVKHNGDH